MNEIRRLTLISDPTDEFPKNANNSFKVRLPERLSLPGEGWHAALMSLTVPDRGQSQAVLATDPHTQVVQIETTLLIRKYLTGVYRFVNFESKSYTVELEEIMSAQEPVTTGNMFWQRVMQEVHNRIMQKAMDEQKKRLVEGPEDRPIVSVKKTWMPQLIWKEDALIIHAIPQADLFKADKSAHTAEFAINLDIALKFELVVKKSSKNTITYDLGPNLQFKLPSTTYTNSTQPDSSDPSQRADYSWNGEHYLTIQPKDLFNTPTHRPFRVSTNGKFLQLSLLVEWRLNNLNTAFEKIVVTHRQTVMVYSDLVESSVVGGGKYPLLREVQLLRIGQGESTVEPLHYQWVKVRGKQMESLEVEIATPSGPLANLSPGKTLVTIGHKRL